MWCRANSGDESVFRGEGTSWFSCPVKQNHMMCSNARPSLPLWRPDSSSGVSPLEGRGRDACEGAPLFHCEYHVVWVTLQDVSCFLSIKPSVLTALPLPSHSSPSSFETLFIFKTTTGLFLFVCLFYPCRFPHWSEVLNRYAGLGARPSKIREESRDREADGGLQGEFKGRRRRRRKNAVMESRIAVRRGRNAREAGRLALINDSVLIQRRHHLFL